MRGRHSGPISPEADRRALVLLAGFCAERRSRRAWRVLLQHCFTARERDAFRRKVGVAARLAAGQSYRLIQEAVGVSPNIIRRVDRWLRARDPRYRRAAVAIVRRHRRVKTAWPKRPFDPYRWDREWGMRMLRRMGAG